MYPQQTRDAEPMLGGGGGIMTTYARVRSRHSYMYVRVPQMTQDAVVQPVFRIQTELMDNYQQ